jgi:capsular polysaccharide biosynthesis protein
MDEVEEAVGIKAAGKVTVSLEPDTRFLSIVAKDVTPQNATIIVNAVTDIFAEKVKEIMMVDNVNVVDYGIIDENPVSPNVKTNIAIGVLLGLVLGSLITFAIELLDTTIKTPEEITSKFGLPVLGVIPAIKPLK